ncbi:glucosaminidase domain-containing protein [Carboxylicivirga sp. M1479]|uniref:glucosaminidase domain-containing protein n=1 Tax=Carboxylicivirga sp. M1479 TaxID=2594476 RepID=UPI001177D853|nr:glucosaminidase domain-containing protein [Carboxylicivirga sp. M1479]TRX63549.1 LysM peptidoglycan-binding domain-containing protein [Carboxylicivirga sp. M1479]
MKYLFLTLSIFGWLISSGIEAQSYRKNTTPEYIDQYKDLAVKEMKRVGIPASITMAQGILESGNGNSTLARKSNNHFGIKCHSDWKGKRVYHDDDAKGECFRKYKTVYESYIDHSEFLVGKKRYASLFELKLTDYKGWAKGLKKAGYATDPKYAHSLINIIEKYKLHQLDENKHWKKPASSGSNDNFEIVTFNTHIIEYNNGVKYIAVEEGDSFESVSEEFGLRPWELYHYNDLPKTAKMQDHRYIYIQGKKGKAHKSHASHVVKADEDLHYISQKYGVKMSKLRKFNNLNEGAKVKEGDQLNLRKRKK